MTTEVDFKSRDPQSDQAENRDHLHRCLNTSEGRSRMRTSGTMKDLFKLCQQAARIKPIPLPHRRFFEGSWLFPVAGPTSSFMPRKFLWTDQLSTLGACGHFSQLLALGRIYLLHRTVP